MTTQTTPGGLPRSSSELAHHPRACDGAVRRAFEFLGKRWNGVIIATLVAGPAGFAELRRAVGGISDSVLSERLSELAAAGLVRRIVDEGPPVSVTYQLTPVGLGLAPAIEALGDWAATNLTTGGTHGTTAHA